MGQKGNWAERGGGDPHCISSGESLLSFFTQSKLRLLESGFKFDFSAWAQFDGVLRFSCGGVHVHQSFKTFTPFLGRCPNININYNSYTKGPKGVFLRSISKRAAAVEVGHPQHYLSLVKKGDQTSTPPNL